MKSITSLLIIMFLLIVPVTLPSHAGCGCGDEKYEEEPLYGTWVNEEYDKTMEIGKVVINPDGTYEATANNNERDPKLGGEFFISNVWDDSDGNIWYEINVESADLSSNHYMIKIGYGGTTLTILQSDNYESEDIDPENKKNEVFIYYAL